MTPIAFTNGTRRTSGRRVLLAVTASVALAAAPAGQAMGSTEAAQGAASVSRAAGDLPSINAGWTAAAFLPKGAPAWRGQTLYLVSPDGKKHDMGRIGRTERIEAVSTNGRFVATTRVVDQASQTVRVSLRDLKAGTVRTADLPEVSGVDLVDGVGSQVVITRGYEKTRVETYDRDLSLVRLLRAPWQGQSSDVVTEQAGRKVGMMTDGKLRLVDPKTGKTQRVVAAPKGYGSCELSRFRDSGHGEGDAAIINCHPSSGTGPSQVFDVPTTGDLATTRRTKGTPPAGYGWANFWDTGRSAGNVATERLECGVEDVHRITTKGVKDINTGYPAGGFRTLDVVNGHVIGLGGGVDCASDATALVSHNLSRGTNTTLLSGGTVGSAVVMPYSR